MPFASEIFMAASKFNYESYTVCGMFVEHNYVYYASRYAEKSVKGMNLECTDTNNWFKSEFDEFYAVLGGAESSSSYEDLIASVFVMNAIVRSLASGTEEKVNTFSV